MSITKEIPSMAEGKRMKSLITPIIFIFILAFCGTVAAGDGIVVNLRTPKNPWADSHLAEKFDIYLSEISHVPIVRNDISDTIFVDVAGELYQDLLARGRMQNAHFLVDIKIDRLDLEKRRWTLIPMLFWRYRIYAILTGTMRILDVSKGRMVKNKKLEYRVRVADSWQLIDENEHDPTLSIPASEMTDLFNRLEDQAALKLYKEIKEISRSNSFGK